jgi:hypothetical protein
MVALQKILPTIARLIFALLYFGVGANSFLFSGLGQPHQEMAQATNSLELAMAQSRFLNPLLSACCLVGGGAMLLRRTTPLGIVILAPLVIIIFFFHLMITGDWWWGALNLVWLCALAWYFRAGFRGLWNYPSHGGVEPSS